MTTNPDNTMGHNSAARADLIRKVARELAAMDGEIKALQEARTAYKNKHIKGDLGFKMADWNTTYRLSQLEGDDRDRLLDTIREGFGALGIGEQSNFLTSMGDAPAAEASAKRGRGRPRKPKPEELGETVNQPHQGIENFEEGDEHAGEAAAGVEGPGF